MLDAVLATLRERPALRAALADAQRGGEVRLEGVSGAHLAAVLAELQVVVQRPLAVVVPADVDLEVLLLDTRAFHPAGGSVVAFPALDVNPYGTVAPHDDIVRERLQTLDRCARGRAEIVLASGRAIVLDGCFSRRRQRDVARTLARERGWPFLFVECRVDNETAYARLAARNERDAHGGWEEVYEGLKQRWETPRLLGGGEHLTLDCARPFDDSIAEIVRVVPGTPEGHALP